MRVLRAFCHLAKNANTTACFLHSSNFWPGSCSQTWDLATWLSKAQCKCRVMPSFDFDNVARSSSVDNFSWDTATGRGFVHASGKVVLQATGHGRPSHSIQEWLRLHKGFAVSRLPEVLTEIVGGSTNRKTNIMASVLLHASMKKVVSSRSGFDWNIFKSDLGIGEMLILSFSNSWLHGLSMSFLIPLRN